MTGFDLIVNGGPVPSNDYVDVLNPATEQVVAKCPTATTEVLDRAVAAAEAAFPAWASSAETERRDALLAIADRVEANTSELAALITQEQGKPLNGYAGKGSRFEVGGSIAWLRATAGMTLSKRTIADDETSRIELHRKPLGVVGSITPWNWPLLIAVWHVAPALRTGNTVVMKPSSLTPLSTLRFVELANEVLPAGVLNVVAGGSAIGRAIAGHPAIAKVVFTGSTPTGRSIMADASGNLKRLTLELGGNDAGIVLPDIDVKASAPGIFDGAFINAGQTCGALKRLYVHEEIHDELCDELVAIANSVTVGNGMDEDTDFGPVQNAAQRQIVVDLAADAKSTGARFLVGGEVDSAKKGYFYPITLVTDVEDGARLVDLEPFGPILPIIRYRNVELVIERANDNPNGLGGSVWSADIDRATSLARRLECGTAWINSHGGVAPHVPFGGVKQSGFGVEFGVEGLAEYTSIQVLNIDKS